MKTRYPSPTLLIVLSALWLAGCFGESPRTAMPDIDSSMHRRPVLNSSQLTEDDLGLNQEADSLRADSLSDGNLLPAADTMRVHPMDSIPADTAFHLEEPTE